MLKTLFLCATSTLALLPGLAHAQAANTQAASGRGAELQEIVVTAQKRSERLEQIPLTVTVASSEQLSKAQITDSRDLAGVITGLTFGMNGLNARPSLRGIYSDSGVIGSEGGVSFYVDGVYRPNAISNTGSLGDVERIEVLKGPQGTLFGRNATGGAVEIVTKTPSMTPTGSLDASMGFYQTRGAVGTMQGYFSAPLIKDVLAFGVAGSVSASDGWQKSIVTNNQYGAVRNIMVRGKLRYSPPSNLSIELAAFYAHKYDEYSQGGVPYKGNTAGLKVVPNDSILPKARDQVSYTPGWEPTARIKDEGASLKIAYETPYGVLTSLSSYEFTSAFFRADIDVSSASVFQSNYLQDDRPYSEDINFTSKPGKLTYVVGAYYYGGRARFNSTGGSYAIQTTSAEAAYAEGTYAVTDQLSVVGGARYNSEEKCGYGTKFAPQLPFYQNKTKDQLGPLGCTTWKATTPRASIKYAPDPGLNFYLTYSKGFKSGFYPASSLGNIPAGPETVTGYEAGVKIVQPYYRFDLSVFHYDMKNKQVQYLTGTSVIVGNAAAAKVDGAEANIDWNVTPAFNLHGGVTYMPTAKYTNYKNAVVTLAQTVCPGLSPCGGVAAVVDESGARLLWSPKMTGNLTATYTWGLSPGDVAFSGTANYTSAVRWDVPGRVIQSAYTTLAGEIRYTPHGANYSVAIWGKNLTNKTYIYGAALSTLADFVNLSPPRQIGVSLHASY